MNGKERERGGERYSEAREKGREGNRVMEEDIALYGSERERVKRKG